MMTACAATYWATCDNTNQRKSSDSIKNQLSNSDIRLSYNKPQTFFVYSI